MKCFLTLIAALLMAPSVALQAADARDASGTSNTVVTVHAARVLERNFLGFGAEWEYEGDQPDNNLNNPVWTANWPEMIRRLDFMRPALLRIMHDARMYTRMEQGRIVPDYDSPRMQVMYRVLDYAKSRNIPVIFGEWWLHKIYLEPLGGPASARWSDELIVPFLVHLCERKGYENIQYFNLMNEPAGLESAPGVQLDFGKWKTAILNLHAALKKKGLEGKVIIVGTDGPGDWNRWIEKTAKDAELRGCIGAYEYHLYAHLKTDKWLPSLLEGKLETDELLLKRQSVNSHDPKGSDKPFFMGEAGIDDGNKGDNQTNRYSFAYGVWMADYAIQSMRAGQAGLIAWDMDDAMHTWGSYGAAGLKGWGFWNSLAGFKGYPADDFKLRPWFYTWSLLCRLFPRGSQTLAVSATGDSTCRAAAARLPESRGLSFAIVNESDTPRVVTLVMPADKPVIVYEYRYSAADRPVDEQGFPVTSGVRKNVELTSGLKVQLPATGVVFLTTQDPATLCAPGK
ncbi:MAG: cellulase family glycosylhydrolase [Planctomycetota bacterium]|nr:cellulase family glycosylhydrolase [Planctomycetota bacterium]